MSEEQLNLQLNLTPPKDAQGDRAWRLSVAAHGDWLTLSRSTTRVREAHRRLAPRVTSLKHKLWHLKPSGRSTLQWFLKAGHTRPARRARTTEGSVRRRRGSQLRLLD